MVINILLADDSAVIRKLITEALHRQPDFKVVAFAVDGKEAINCAKHYKPNIVILDIEMPNMDGLTALPFILEAAPKTKVIVASRLTKRNAKTSLEALELGASDYIPKPEVDHLEEFYTDLVNKIRALSAPGVPVKTPQSVPPELTRSPKRVSSFAGDAGFISVPSDTTSEHKPQAIAIATSTGGPQTLIKLFTDLDGRLNCLPIFITQHMPTAFIPIFAGHITTAAKMPCIEGVDGDIAKPGTIYLAPGDRHMVVKRVGSQVVVHTNQDPPVNFCRPAADPMFLSLSKAYGRHLLAVVLTGMGHDGTDGSVEIAKNGGCVIAQDATSSVVYGMPRAVAEKGICQKILPLDSIAPYLLKRCR